MEALDPDRDDEGGPIDFTWPGCVVEYRSSDICDDCNAHGPAVHVSSGSGDGNYSLWCLPCYAKQRTRFKR